VSGDILEMIESRFVCCLFARREPAQQLPRSSAARHRAGTFARGMGSPANTDVADNEENRAMNWDRVEGNWKEFKGKVQQKWGKLTNDDLNVIEGKRSELIGRLQQRYGVAKDQAEREIDTWLNTVH
jgi:uncharacterized protein YjbJ (UPF0337 family)